MNVVIPYVRYASSECYLLDRKLGTRSFCLLSSIGCFKMTNFLQNRVEASEKDCFVQNLGSRAGIESVQLDMLDKRCFLVRRPDNHGRNCSG